MFAQMAIYLIIGILLGFILAGPLGALIGGVGGLLFTIIDQLNVIIEKLNLQQKDGKETKK